MITALPSVIKKEKKTAQEKQKAGRQGTETLVVSLGFTKPPPHVITAAYVPRFLLATKPFDFSLEPIARAGLHEAPWQSKISLKTALWECKE